MHEMKAVTSLMVAAATAAALGAGATSVHAQDKVTVWSHFADHQGVRSFFEEVQKTFSDENPGKELDIVFYSVCRK